MLFMAAAAGEATAVDVEQDGQLLPFLHVFGGEDVQEQAVLAVCIAFALTELVVVEILLFIQLLVIEGPGLIGAVAVLGRIVNAFPGSYLFGIFPASGGGVTDALVSDGAGNTSGSTANFTAGCRNDLAHNIHLFV